MTIAAVTGAVTAQPKQAEEAKPAAATGPLEAPAAGADHFFGQVFWRPRPIIKIRS